MGEIRMSIYEKPHLSIDQLPSRQEDPPSHREQLLTKYAIHYFATLYIFYQNKGLLAAKFPNTFPERYNYTRETYLHLTEQLGVNPIIFEAQAYQTVFGDDVPKNSNDRVDGLLNYIKENPLNTADPSVSE
jgi:hypothetical protein